MWPEHRHVYARQNTSLAGHSASRTHPEVSPDAPLCVLHGTDSFSRIGLPDGTRIVDRESALAKWAAEVKRSFPTPTNPETTVSLDSFEANSSKLSSSAGQERCGRQLLPCIHHPAVPPTVHHP